MLVKRRYSSCVRRRIVSHPPSAVTPANSPTALSRPGGEQRLLQMPACLATRGDSSCRTECGERTHGALTLGVELLGCRERPWLRTATPGCTDLAIAWGRRAITALGETQKSTPRQASLSASAHSGPIPDVDSLRADGDFTLKGSEGDTCPQQLTCRSVGRSTADNRWRTMREPTG